MNHNRGLRFGVRTLDDLLERSVISPGCDCWKRPANVKPRASRPQDPDLWNPDLQVVLSLGAAVYVLVHGKRMKPGFAFVRTCETWGCANPAHRRLISFAKLASMNAKPCSLARKLSVAAARRASSRISDADVAAIASSTGNANLVAERYGISRSYVYMLRQGKCRNNQAAPNSSVFAWRQAA